MAPEENKTGPVDGSDTAEAKAPAPMARPATLFSPRVKMTVVFLLIAAGLTYFAWTAFGSATVTYASVAEVATAGPTEPERSVGVIGKLVENSYVRSADGVTAHFRLVDEGGTQEMQVQYKGEIGQVFFNDHSEIILDGRMGPDNVFIADDLQVRCPTKYLTEQEKAELEAQENGDPLPPPYQPDYYTDAP